MGLNTYPANPWPQSSENSGGGGGEYKLPIAGTDKLGGVMVGENLSIDANTGALSALAKVFDFSSGDVATGWIWDSGKELFLKKVTNINSGENSQVRTQIGSELFYDKAFLIFGWVERNVDSYHTKIPLPVSWPGEANALWQISVNDTTHAAYVDRRMPIAVLQNMPVTFIMGYTKISA